MTTNNIQKMFIIAGLSNILGVLICSRLFTNQTLMTLQPSVMGGFGLISIILWGLAYIAVHKNYRHVLPLVAVFCVEKLVYVGVWLKFVATHSLAEIYGTDRLAGLFYGIYGVNDFLFMLFFAYVLFSHRNVRSPMS